jgi:hypothetical protein
MKKNTCARRILICCLLVFSCISYANDPEISGQNRSYILGENQDYFSIAEINTGSLDYKDHTFFAKHEDTFYQLSHLRHSKIDNTQYLIWNFVPVGMGYCLANGSTEQVAAEWKINYEPSDTFQLSPKFTGKRSHLFSSLIGSEVIFSYAYHYQDDPQPSFWDISLKYSLYLIPFEKWHLGAFVEPKTFMKGIFSQPKSENPFPFTNIYTSGLWTEFEFKNKLVLQFQGAVSILEKYVDKYLAKYSAASSLGFYF